MHAFSWPSYFMQFESKTLFKISIIMKLDGAIDSFYIMSLEIGGLVDQKRRGLPGLWERRFPGRHYLENLFLLALSGHYFHPKRPSVVSREAEWDTANGIACTRRNTRKQCFPRCHDNIHVGFLQTKINSMPNALSKVRQSTVVFLIGHIIVQAIFQHLLAGLVYTSVWSEYLKNMNFEQSIPGGSSSATCSLLNVTRSCNVRDWGLLNNPKNLEMTNASWCPRMGSIISGAKG